MLIHANIGFNLLHPGAPYRLLGTCDKFQRMKHMRCISKLKKAEDQLWEVKYKYSGSSSILTEFWLFKSHEKKKPEQ